VSERAYPIRPLPEDDPRFTCLAIDVAEVLERHGYPEITHAWDLLDLHQALYRFLYTGEGER
jgi:hypothetical protein